VSGYTSRAMTHGTDIFPALQGLAKSMPLSLGPYLAGLWRYTLAFNLTWGLYTTTLVGRSEDWRAPTWSWASATDKVTWWNNRPPLTRENVITVVDAGVIAIGDDVTGQIRSGELRI
jgi:hypothetical protein